MRRHVRASLVEMRSRVLSRENGMDSENDVDNAILQGCRRAGWLLCHLSQVQTQLAAKTFRRRGKGAMGVVGSSAAAKHRPNGKPLGSMYGLCTMYTSNARREERLG